MYAENLQRICITFLEFAEVLDSEVTSKKMKFTNSC